MNPPESARERRLDLSARPALAALIPALILVWLGLVLAFYYRRVSHLVLLGPVGWVRDNPSLYSFLKSLQRLVQDAPASWQLPFFQEASVSFVTSVLGTLAILLAGQVLGLAIRRLLRWKAQDWREAFLFQTALGLGGLSSLFLLEAWLGLYRPGFVRAFLGLLLLAGALWLAVRGLKSTRKVPVLNRRVFASMRSDRLWLGIVLLAVAIGLVGALAPEIEYDALWYHLWLPQQWLLAGHPVDFIQEYVSLYPLHWELLYGAGLVMGGAGAAKLLSFACLPLGALLAWQLTRRFTPGASPWLAAALFVTTPIVLWEATTAYVDLALALFLGLAVYALLAYLEQRTWQWLVLTAILFGLSLAIKNLALLLWVPAVAGLGLFLWREGRSWRAALPAFVVAGVSLLFALPWYLRSYLASGNPFFPDLYAIFGAYPVERWSPVSERGLAAFKDHFGTPRTLQNSLLLPWNMTVHAAQFGGTLGPLYLILLPLLALGRRSQAVTWMTGLGLSYLILWASPLSSFQMRFLVPITPLLAVLGGEGLHRGLGWFSATKRTQQLATAGLTFMLFLNLPPFTSFHEGDRAVWDGWLTHIVHTVPVGVVTGHTGREAYLEKEVASYRAWQYINSNLPANARVLTFSGGDQFYSQRERISSDASLANQAIWGAPRGEEQKALRELHRLGVTHLLFDKREIDQGKLDDLAITEPGVIALKCDKEYEDDRFILYRLH
jgi:Dolichyl-phosphate-mannose-protein mannosyltransferase